MTIWDSASLTRKIRWNLRISSKKKIVLLTYMLSVLTLYGSISYYYIWWKMQFAAKNLDHMIVFNFYLSESNQMEWFYSFLSKFKREMIIDSYSKLSHHESNNDYWYKSYVQKFFNDCMSSEVRSMFNISWKINIPISFGILSILPFRVRYFFRWSWYFDIINPIWASSSSRSALQSWIKSSIPSVFWDSKISLILLNSCVISFSSKEYQISEKTRSDLGQIRSVI